MNVVKKFVFICLMTIVTGALAEEELEIVIDKGVENSLPIVILPFGWSQAQNLPPIDMTAIIANDLARSGRFAPMSEADMPQKPTQMHDINFKDWRLLGMENLVLGNIKQNSSGDFDIEFRLIDVYKGTQITGFHIPATHAQLRRTAHQISDIIFEKLTGIRGAFNTRIAYITVKRLEEKKRLYSLQIADADGYSPQVLLESSEPLMSPSWSPDGKSLAYVSFEKRSSAIYVQDILSGQRRRVASSPGINSAPAWSPDGSRLALTLSKSGDPEIYILHLSSNSLQQVTHNRAIDTEPSWSPDGNKLVFTSDRGGGPQVYELSLRGKQVKRLTFNGPYHARPRYSPDGKKIVMIHGEKKRYRIAILDLENSYLNVLTDSRLDESPSFSPNGSMIIYATTVYRGTELAAVAADGSVHQRLALQDGEVREPAWGPFPGK
ncbi:MAG: Tol-Pal system beta propeller repeat protein TolB [Gammaproteobacteria bacterium]|jgi:TolB protein|nr:Tol-Pal system beta propeller repeat protein TolB [Gammaproteobacteria bacterium]